MLENLEENVAVTIPQSQFDSAWKDILNVWFCEFMVFFYPQLSEKIDWSLGYETLDKELQTIVPKGILGNRFVDKLMKVKSKEGKELWVLLHIEIQGKKQTDFEKRLFEYYYRLHERYAIPIMTLAILSDGNLRWRPSVYEVKVWGLDILSFRFFATKLLDYMNQQETLEKTTNPFGLIVLAQLAALKTQRNVNERFRIKFSLTRRLYKRGLERNAILSLYKFIDWVLMLPKDLEMGYNEQIYQLEKEYDMGYITSAERFGIEKGYKQGRLEGEQLLLTKQLNHRFAHAASAYVSKIKDADAETLLHWGEKILDAKTIEDVFAE